MTFSGERYGARNLKDETESQKRIDELEAENKMQDNVIGLHEWNTEILKEEMNSMKEFHGIDPLTGVFRREVLVDELSRSLLIIRNKIKEQREGVNSLQNVSLVFIDLDKFKQVNDTYGHLEGDEVLRKIAEIMKKSLRGTDILARYGGDEFVALLPNTSEKNAILVAEKLRSSVADDSKLKNLGVTVSLGVCSSEVSAAEDSETFIKHTDEAAYVAKRAGGNRVEVYS